MNEDIKKNEISEEQLEGVSGGGNYTVPCPKCGGGMLARIIEGRNAKVCESCSYVWFSNAIKLTTKIM